MPAAGDWASSGGSVPRSTAERFCAGRTAGAIIRPEMSQQNVEIVRAAYDAYNARDMDALRELYDPDAIIVRGLDGWPEPGPYVGREEVMRTFENLRAAWDSDTLESVRLIDAGDRV